MPISLSPLRYPGGKSKIFNKVKTIIETNSLGDRIYVEPFAGGFGIGLRLLCNGIVKSAILNDFDSHIYHFWYAVLHHTDELLKMIKDTPITIKEREKQKSIYIDKTTDNVSDGFATLFLNRVNFSGIIDGGPIGGLSQNGNYKIDCRFKKKEIENKIKKIALLKNYIKLYNCDASDLIKNHLRDIICKSFFNIDPPYVKKGQTLYSNYFKEEDHRSFERIITEYLVKTQWIVTYDDCDLIREIYKNYHLVNYEILHNARGNVRGKEIVVTNIPKNLFSW